MDRPDRYYAISNWDAHYEVDDSGAPYRPGKEKRKGPLLYIRQKVHGRNWNPGIENLYRLAKGRMYEVLGHFDRLRQIPGQESRDTRDGTLFNEHGEPASAADLAKYLHVSVGKMQDTLKILCDPDLGWMEERFFSGSDGFSDAPGIPGIPGNIPSTNQPTNTTKSNQDKTSGCAHAKQAVCHKVGAAMESWRALKRLIGNEFGSDRGIDVGLGHIIQTHMTATDIELGQVVQRLLAAVEESRAKDNPAGWFMKCVLMQEFGYRPRGGQDPNTIDLATAAKRLAGA